MSARRPSLRRLVAGGSAATLLALVMVGTAGVAPASANSLTDVRTYMQTAPANVTASGTIVDPGGLTDEEERQWRDLTRNYQTDPRNGQQPYSPVYPASRPQRLGGAVGTLWAGLEKLQAVEGPDGRTQWMYEIEDPWTIEDGRPAHVPEDEWNDCARSRADSQYWGNFFNGLRDWSAGFGADGRDCNLTRAGWGAPVSEDWVPIKAAPAGPASFPVTLSAGGVTMTIGAPVWSDVQHTANSRTVYRGYLYPVTVSGDIAGQQRIQLQGNGVATTATGPIGSTTYSNQYYGTTPIYVDPALCGPAATLCLTAGTITSSWSSQVDAGAMFLFTKLSMTVYKTISPLVMSSSGDRAMSVDVPYAPILVAKGAGSPANPDANAPVVLQTTVTGKDGSTYSCRTVEFVQAPGVVAPMPCNPGVPDEFVETVRTVEVVPATETGYVGGSTPGREIARTETTPEYQQWKTLDPGCTGSNRCLLDLRRLDPNVSCFDDPDLCADWATDPNKTSKYQCYYGSRAVPIEDCDIYGPTFKQANRDAGIGYAPGDKTNPNPGPTTNPPPNTAIPAGSAPANPNQSRQCFPTGWGVFNPVEWVYRPVRCAIEWAFVPRNQAINGHQTALHAAYRASPLGALSNSLEAMGSIFNGTQGCSGLPFEISMFGVDYRGRLFEACSEPWAGVATFTRNLLSGVILAGGFLAIIRYGAAVFGFVQAGQASADGGSTGRVRFK